MKYIKTFENFDTDVERVNPEIDIKIKENIEKSKSNPKYYDVITSLNKNNIEKVKKMDTTTSSKLFKIKLKNNKKPIIFTKSYLYHLGGLMYTIFDGEEKYYVEENVAEKIYDLVDSLKITSKHGSDIPTHIKF